VIFITEAQNRSGGCEIHKKRYTLNEITKKDLFVMCARLKASAAALLILALFSSQAQAMQRVTLYGAASTQPVIDALIPKMNTHGLALHAVYAGSATLARQIERGAPDVDIFVSANLKWMNHLEGQGLLEPGTRRSVATNRLVLIAAPDVHLPATPDLTDARAIIRALGNGRLAIADPDFVPAGMYGREALASLGVWDALHGRLAPTKDVTGALLLVTRGEARLGIVYQSDVRRVKGLQVYGVFPNTSHAPIVYQAALLKGRTGDGARKFLNALSGTEGQASFRDAGFGGAP